MDYWVVRLNSVGAITWQNSIGGDFLDYLYSVDQTSDGGYFLCGDSKSDEASGDKTEDNQSGQDDFWILKLYPDPCNGLLGYADTDQDGYGDPANSFFAADCILPGGYVDNNTDCNDASITIHPYAPEVCSNLIDDDCDGQIDEDLKTYFADADGDTYGNAGSSIQTCVQPNGYVVDNTDCNDANSSVHPNAIELCNNLVDDDCNGVVDSDCNCQSTASLSQTNITSSSALLLWNAIAGAEKYRIRYRYNTNDWSFANAGINHKNIQGLTPDKWYVWQVKTVCDISSNLTSNWSVTGQFKTSSLKLEDNDTRLNLEVFPNPVSDFATIQFSLSNSSDAEISLFDLQGRNIKTIANETFSQGLHTLNFSVKDLPRGIYLLQLKTGPEVHTQKLIIQ